MEQKLSDEIEDSDIELAAQVKEIKLLLKAKVTKTKARSDQFPFSLRYADKYKKASLQYNAFLRIIELCGRLGIQARMLAQRAEEMVKEIEDKKNEQPQKDRSKIILN